MKIKSNILEIIFKFLIILVIFFLMIFFALKHGISVERIDSKFFAIEKLYIKLDKKIILTAKNIKLGQITDGGEIKIVQDDLLGYLSKFNFISEIFDHIYIESFSKGNLSTSISFKDNNFIADNEYFYIDFDAKKDKNVFYIKTNKFTLKQQNMHLDAKLSVNLRIKQYYLNTTAKSDFASFHIRMFRQKDDINMQILSLDISDIKRAKKLLLSNLKLPQAVDEWVFDRAIAKHYKIQDAKISFNLSKLDTKAIELKASASDIAVRFHDGLKPATVPSANITLKNNNVLIDYNQATYNKTKLDKGSVNIYNALLGKNMRLGLELSAQNISLDDDLVGVLAAYDIHTGVMVKNASSKASYKLNMDLHTHKITSELNASVSSAILSPLNLSLSAAKATMSADNHLLISSRVASKDISANAKLDFDINAKKASINLSNLNANYGKYLQTKDMRLDATMDFQKGLKIIIPKLAARIDINKAIKLRADNLALIVPYSKLLQAMCLDRSSLDLDYADGVYEVELGGFGLAECFLYANDKPYQSNKITINYSDHYLNIVDDEKRVFLNEDKTHKVYIDIKDLQIKQNESLEDFLALNKDDQSSKIYEIKADNIDYEISDLQKSVIIKNIIAHSDKSSTISADIYAPGSSTLGARAKIKLLPKQMNMELEHISPQLLNHMMGKEVFSGGSFLLRIKGDGSENYKARFYMYDTLLKGYKTYQRILTYINAVPNLLVFKSSNLNEKGFVIKHGHIDVIKADDVYLFPDVQLFGSSADVKASGVYDAKYKDIKLIADLITMKSISSIISSTPIVSQIILGDKKQFSTRLKITGDIDDVKVSSELAAELATSPFVILKNIVTLPVNLFK